MVILRRVATILIAVLLVQWCGAATPDPDFYIFLCFGQSNTEDAAPIEEQDRQPVDQRFQMLAGLDLPKLDRNQGEWYPATPPLCQPHSGLCPVDYFGRSLVQELPANVRVGVINVTVGGCKMELFDKDNYQAYAADAPDWMTSKIKTYGGSRYDRLVEIAKLAKQAEWNEWRDGLTIPVGQMVRLVRWVTSLDFRHV